MLYITWMERNIKPVNLLFKILLSLLIAQISNTPDKISCVNTLAPIIKYAAAAAIAEGSDIHFGSFSADALYKYIIPPAIKKHSEYTILVLPTSKYSPRIRFMTTAPISENHALTLPEIRVQ